MCPSVCTHTWIRVRLAGTYLCPEYPNTGKYVRTCGQLPDRSMACYALLGCSCVCNGWKDKHQRIYLKNSFVWISLSKRSDRLRRPMCHAVSMHHPSSSARPTGQSASPWPTACLSGIAWPNGPNRLTEADWIQSATGKPMLYYFWKNSNPCIIFRIND